MSAQSKTANDLRGAERSLVAALRQKICFWIKNKSELRTELRLHILFTSGSLQTPDL